LVRNHHKYLSMRSLRSLRLITSAVFGFIPPPLDYCFHRPASIVFSAAPVPAACRASPGQWPASFLTQAWMRQPAFDAGHSQQFAAVRCAQSLLPVGAPPARSPRLASRLEPARRAPRPRVPLAAGPRSDIPVRFAGCPDPPGGQECARSLRRVGQGCAGRFARSVWDTRRSCRPARNAVLTCFWGDIPRRQPFQVTLL